MTSYKEKFDASEHKAHYKNIATKILRDMTDLRSKVETSPNIRRRWIWELIQNAKDVHYNDGVNIQIKYLKNHSSPRLIFKHDGKPFTADNIRFLIEQISSKDRDKDESGKTKSTGKFGTGFLTTHLLSEKVVVRGVAKEEGLTHRLFKLKLDRSGFDLSSVMDAVEAAKKTVSNLDDLDTYGEYNKENFNTSFIYPLSDDLSFKVADSGLADLKACLPYCLAFVDEVESVEISHTSECYYKGDEVEELGGNIELVKVYVSDDILEDQTEIIFVKLTKDFTSIVLPVSVDTEGVISIQPIESNVPKLFCDFPLIGAENFTIPIVINNPNFHPTDPRDGVFLTETSRENPDVDDNKEIIAVAVELYFELLEYASENNWQNLHLLGDVNPLNNQYDWVSEKWFNEEVLKPIRKKLLTVRLVTDADGNLQSILNENGDKYMWFPSSSTKEIRAEMWNVGQFWFPHCLPAFGDIELWNRLIWHDCGKLTLSKFAEFVEGRQTLKKLSDVIKGDVIEWLNSFYKLLQMDDKEYHSIIDKKSIVPNQKGEFVRRAQLSEDFGGIDDEFKDILELLGNDVRSKLAEENIELDFDDRVVDESFIVREINTEILEKTNDREAAKDFRPAFNKVLLYFKNNPQRSKKLFPELYSKKYRLFDEEEIVENIDKAEQLDDLLSEFNVTNADSLRALIERGADESNRGLLPVTQEIILSMGITSIEEWEEALRDKNLKELFSHNSVPSHDMFVYAQTHIKKAKDAIIDYLEELDEYDLSNMEETATTILAGILKSGKEISIVTRPAYNSEVIIYYGSEKDVLDYEDSELWVDDGFDIQRITLGHILKSAQIRKFPI